MIGQRNPVVADMVVATMAQEACLSELRGATDRLDRECFGWRPSWRSLREGQRPPEPEVGEPGEWRHGWQHWSSFVSDAHFRKEVMLHGRTAARRAHLRSHSGFNAGTALARCRPWAHHRTLCSCHCKSPKRGVRDTVPLNGWWAAFSAKQVPVCDRCS